jgi:hypothetical protein
MSASNWLEDAWIKYAFTTSSPGTRPTAWYASLHKADPTDAGGSEVSTGSDDANYARQSVTLATTGTNGQVKNSTVVNFPAAAGGSSYTVTHFGVYDAATSGNLLASGALDISKAVTAGTILSFAVNDLTLQVD